MDQIIHLIDLNQFGLSTTHALLSLVHHLYKVTYHHDQCVRVLLLDFSKAFDKINILLTKMKDMAIDTTLIEWVRSFLTNRRQRASEGWKFYLQLSASEWWRPTGNCFGPYLVHDNDRK